MYIPFYSYVKTEELDSEYRIVDKLLNFFKPHFLQL